MSETQAATPNSPTTITPPTATPMPIQEPVMVPAPTTGHTLDEAARAPLKSPESADTNPGTTALPPIPMQVAADFAPPAPHAPNVHLPHPPHPSTPPAASIVSSADFSTAELHAAAYLRDHIDEQLTDGLRLSLINMLSRSNEIGNSDITISFKGPEVAANVGEMSRELLAAFQKHPAVATLVKQGHTISIDQISNDQGNTELNVVINNVSPQHYAGFIHTLARPVPTHHMPVHAQPHASMVPMHLAEAMHMAPPHAVAHPADANAQALPQVEMAETTVAPQTAEAAPSFAVLPAHHAPTPAPTPTPVKLAAGPSMNDTPSTQAVMPAIHMGQAQAVPGYQVA